jgi:hypothetical protein
MLAYRFRPAAQGAALAVSAVLLAAGCGRDTGILVSITRDPSLNVAVQQLRVTVGSNTQGNAFLQTVQNPDVTVDVNGRDLLNAPYTLFYRPDNAETMMQIWAAVVGTNGNGAVAFGAFDAPLPFRANEVQLKTITLRGAVEGTDFTRTATGCLLFGDHSLSVDNDRDCDGHSPPEDCNDDDAEIHPGAMEICRNMIDENCSGMADEQPCTMQECMPGEQRPCGNTTTAGKGVCRLGTQFCINGMWGQCSGEVRPAPAEACNGEDDDCDGMTDEGLPMVTCGLGVCQRMVAACLSGQPQMCVAPAPQVGSDTPGNGLDDDCDGAIDEDGAVTGTCVRVDDTAGDDLSADPVNGTPFKTIQRGIDFAAAGAVKMVCVAMGTACTGSPPLTYAANVTMASGVSVYGGYETTGWTRCAPVVQPLIKPQRLEGVLFGNNVTTLAILDGFTIERQGASTQTAGITVDGATHATIANVTVNALGTAPTTIGINVLNAGTPLITRSAIFAGAGTTASAAVRASGARPIIRGNCGTIDGAGQCKDFCGSNVAMGLHARRGGTGGESYGVLLENSPDSVVETSSICEGGGDHVGGVRVRTNGTGVVIRGNNIDMRGGAMNTHGVWLEECGNAAPWVVENYFISGTGVSNTTTASAVRSFGACHALVDHNHKVWGGGEGTNLRSNGVHCGNASRCVVVENEEIFGSGNGAPASAYGVNCEGGCSRVARNALITGRGGVTSAGVHVRKVGPLIERNRIDGGCATMASSGVLLVEAYARVENNEVRGGSCDGGAMPRRSSGITMHIAAAAAGNTTGLYESDIHSNTIDGGGNPVVCESNAIEITPLGTATPHGVIRNNILRAGVCNTRYGIHETAASADPRIVENNDFDPTGQPTALYGDENTTALNTTTAINGLMGAFDANISVDPLFMAANDWRLQTGSMCIMAGTAVGAPSIDINGNPRGMPPDIGAHER